jgi:hypothetical protein
MDFTKYVYVSPQQYVSAFDEYRYEYIVDGKRFNSASFKYRQGKDVFKKIELAAWRDNKNVRKLNQFEWRNMYLLLFGNDVVAANGQRIQFYSKAQKRSFEYEMKAIPFVRAVEQLENGDIVLDHIFEAAGRYIGYSIFISSRGKSRSRYGYSVALDGDVPYLVRTIDDKIPKVE